ncbi:MAG: hypothetical protein KJO36_05770 [Acidimicrobiia bacterium]|nr:hypothetical protein [Acidimicrobiia bacterium]
MFRIVVAALAVVGLVSLFTGGSALGIGALVLAPFFFIAKVVFFMMMFGFFARALGHRGHIGRAYGREAGYGPRSWKYQWMSEGRRPTRYGSDEDSSSAKDEFEAWHRMSHAREEVDSWVEDLEN